MSGKVVLSFVLGAAAGAVGMYFGMKQACEIYIEKKSSSLRLIMRQHTSQSPKKERRRQENGRKSGKDAEKP